MESVVKLVKNKAGLLLLMLRLLLTTVVVVVVVVVVVAQHHHASHVANDVQQVLKLSGFPSYLHILCYCQ